MVSYLPSADSVKRADNKCCGSAPSMFNLVSLIFMILFLKSVSYDILKACVSQIICTCMFWKYKINTNFVNIQNFVVLAAYMRRAYSELQTKESEWSNKWGYYAILYRM